jgi:uncharacterized protein YlxP (DUF503 family)
MHVGVCRIVLRLPENQSLKGKRHVIHSLKDRVHNRFNVSIAETEANGQWQQAVLGVSCVSNDARHVNEVLSEVVRYVEGNGGDVQLLDYDIQVFQEY